MTTTIETIEIYYDEQAGAEPGWAYRATVKRDGETETETGPSGSGPIDGPAAEALTELVEHWCISDDQQQAIADLVDSEGWGRSRVMLADVGPLWP